MENVRDHSSGIWNFAMGSQGQVLSKQATWFIVLKDLPATLWDGLREARVKARRATRKLLK